MPSRTSVPTSSIAEFILARVDEDEAVAREASHEVALENDRYGWSSVDYWGSENEAHGRRWAPPRVLAHCAALRVVVSAHPVGRAGADPLDPDAEFDEFMSGGQLHRWYWKPAPVNATLLALARIWSAHPDFDAAWGAQS